MGETLDPSHAPDPSDRVDLDAAVREVDDALEQILLRGLSEGVASSRVPLQRNADPGRNDCA